MRFRIVMVTAFAAAIALAPSLSRADDDQKTEPAQNVHITLNDGSEYSGELVEKVPQDHVTLKLADGKVKRFEWEDIRKPNKAPPQPTQAAPRPSGARAELTADSDSAELQQRIGVTTVMTYMATPTGAIGSPQNADIWQTLCVAPCTAEVPTGMPIRVGGSGIVGSSWFILGPGQHAVVAETGSSIKRGFGWAFTVIGGLSLLGGLLIFAVTPRTITTCSGLLSVSCQNTDQTGDILAITLPMMGIGAGVMGLGLWMILSAKTHVTVDGAKPEEVSLRLGPLRANARGLAF
jgi:hypothetical protein